MTSDGQTTHPLDKAVIREQFLTLGRGEPVEALVSAFAFVIVVGAACRNHVAGMAQRREQALVEAFAPARPAACGTHAAEGKTNRPQPAISFSS